MILFVLVAVAIALLLSPHGAGDVPAPIAGPIADPHQAKTLAGRFEPSLVLERQDGFWPISVETIDELRPDGKARQTDEPRPDEERPCLAPRRGAECRRITVERLPWDRGPSSAFVDYPAANDDPEGERLSFARALGNPAPRTGTQLYFYLTGRSRRAPLTLQYWFYYPFNYLPVRSHGADLADIDLHEGDFEGLSVLLSAKAHKPVYVWMPRHTEEGERFTWNEGALHRKGAHVVGFVAKGSHATYESCGRKFRTVLVNLPLVERRVLDVPDDYVSCAHQDRYRLRTDVPLVNLARTWWACWPGHLGDAPELGSVPILGQGLEQIDANGPQSPLFQQKFDEDHPRPCASVDAPAPPLDRSEVLPDPRTARALDVHGGRLDDYLDDCQEWFQRPPEGSYLVACDQVRLKLVLLIGPRTPGPPGPGDLGRPAAAWGAEHPRGIPIASCGRAGRSDDRHPPDRSPVRLCRHSRRQRTADGRIPEVRDARRRHASPAR